MPPKRKSDAGENDGAAAKKKKETPEGKKLTKKTSVREKIPDVSDLDFSSEAKSKEGKKWNKKFASWNINGIRAWLEKNGHSYIKAEDPDIFCVQETKCEVEKIPEEVKVAGYHTYWLSGDKDGYSGTGLYSKQEPIKVTYGIGDEKHDKEGRVITAEFEDYYFVTAYVPNSGRGLPRLEYRTTEWDPAFRAYLVKLDKTKPVMACGDLNVAHLDIDLKNPKSNQKTAGFTPQERKEFGKLLEEGFIDSFRHLYPDKTDTYSYWTYMMNARGKNVGWRLDYFLLSKRLESGLCDSLMRSDVFGSDHCPIVLFMHL